VISTMLIDLFYFIDNIRTDLNRNVKQNSLFSVT